MQNSKSVVAPAYQIEVVSDNDRRTNRRVLGATFEYSSAVSEAIYVIEELRLRYWLARALLGGQAFDRHKRILVPGSDAYIPVS